MAHNIHALETHEAAVGSTRNASASFVGQLDDGELLTGATPVVTAEPSGLTISNARVNTAAQTISGERVEIGQAVLWRVSGFAAGTEYKYTITVTSNASPSQILIGTATVNGVSVSA